MRPRPKTALSRDHGSSRLPEGPRLQYNSQCNAEACMPQAEKGIMYNDEASCCRSPLSARAQDARPAKKANLAAMLMAHRARAPSLSAEVYSDLRAGAPRAGKGRRTVLRVRYIQLSPANGRLLNHGDDKLMFINVVLSMSNARARECDYIHAVTKRGCSVPSTSSQLHSYMCSSLGILWSCDNTVRSYIWERLC
jgi:hypothetical protein